MDNEKVAYDKKVALEVAYDKEVAYEQLLNKYEKKAGRIDWFNFSADGFDDLLFHIEGDEHKFAAQLRRLADSLEELAVERNQLEQKLRTGRTFRSKRKLLNSSSRGWFRDSPGHSLAARGQRVPWRRGRQK